MNKILAQTDLEIAQEYILKNKEVSDVLETYYDMLSNLTEETYQEAINYVKENKNVFFKDHSSGLSFFHYTVIASSINFKHFEIYLDICVEFTTNFKSQNISEIELIHEHINFSNCIYYLFTKNFFSIDTIMAQSSISNFIFINFLPEIKQYDKEYVDIKIKNILSEQDIDKHDISFLNFVINNPEKHILYRKLNFHPSHIHKLIRDDNVDEFTSYLSRNNIDFNYKFPFSYYERAKTEDIELSLIKCAAIYGSINIFKYLWNQNTIKGNSILRYAYCGKNYDIIHLCENEHHSEEAFEQALFLHSNELIDYSFDLYKTKIIENMNMKKNYLHSAVVYSNFDIIYSNLHRILSYARNDEHIINFPNADCFLYYSAYNYNLFKLIFCQRNKDLNILKCQCFFNCLTLLLHQNINDQFKVIFKELYENINFIFYLREGIQTNHEIANYILDLQIDEMKSNDHNKSIIFNNINSKISFDDLKLAIKHYNENIVVKIIKLYDLFKLSENAFNFVAILSNNISKKMMVSLFNQLSSFLQPNLLICFSAFLKVNGYSSISDDIMNNINNPKHDI